MVKLPPEPIDVETGARVRARRRELGLTQQDLGDALGVTFQQVQKYEYGRNQLSPAMLTRAAAILKTTISALVGEQGGFPLVAISGSISTDPEALALLEAYACIEEDEARRHLLGVAIALADASERRAPKDPNEERAEYT